MAAHNLTYTLQIELPHDVAMELTRRVDLLAERGIAMTHGHLASLMIRKGLDATEVEQ